MQIRKAKISDVEKIYNLISHFAEQGLMLIRPRALLYEAIREFTVAEKNGHLVGASSLHIIWEDLAEIRSLAVNERFGDQGIGRMLVKASLQEARELELKRVFALTYKEGFFLKCGFSPVSKEKLPQKVWKECMDCPKFPYCDETAVMIDFTNIA